MPEDTADARATSHHILLCCLLVVFACVRPPAMKPAMKIIIITLWISDMYNNSKCVCGSITSCHIICAWHVNDDICLINEKSQWLFS